MKKKTLFSRVNNLIPLRPAGIIVKLCLINLQLNHIKRLMGSWNFRKVIEQSKQLDLSQTIWRQAKHSTTLSVKAEHIWGRDCASNITEGTSYSVSQFCNVRGDLQTVIEMLKDNGNTGYNSRYSAEREHSFKLASLGTNNSISIGAQSCCDLENLGKTLMKYSGGYLMQNIGLL